MNPPRPLRRDHAITIAEMLMVLAIMTMFIALAASGFRKSWESQEIRASALQVMQDMAMAQHHALKLGRTVEMRFYRYMPQDVPLLKAVKDRQFVGHAHAYQLLVHQNTGRSLPLFPVQTFQGGTILSQHRQISTVAPHAWRESQEPGPADATGKATHLHPELGIGPYQFFAIEFRPDGSTNLDPDPVKPWTLTFGPSRWHETPNEFPSTREGSKIRVFSTITIDGSTGATKLW
jgi:uncharacterized protein (TIGR02596 family)